MPAYTHPPATACLYRLLHSASLPFALALCRLLSACLFSLPPCCCYLPRVPYQNYWDQLLRIRMWDYWLAARHNLPLRRLINIYRAKNSRACTLLASAPAATTCSSFAPSFPHLYIAPYCRRAISLAARLALCTAASAARHAARRTACRVPAALSPHLFITQLVSPRMPRGAISIGLGDLSFCTSIASLFCTARHLFFAVVRLLRCAAHLVAAARAPCASSHWRCLACIFSYRFT